MGKTNLQIEIECAENWVEHYTSRPLRRLVPLNQYTPRQRAELQRSRAMWRHLVDLRAKQARNG